MKRLWYLLFALLVIVPQAAFGNVEMDRESRAFLDVVNENPMPPLESIPLESFRTDNPFWGYKSDAPIKGVEDISISGPYGQIPLRIYTPLGAGPFPVMVTFHGGGWVTGSLKAHDGFCREICSHAECLVVSVDYRLAPENKFPIPLEECYFATEWVSKHISQYRGDPYRLSVSGDSAGGNLAAAVALMAKDRKHPFICSQVLIYPVLDHNFLTSSYSEFENGYLLTKGQMEFFWKSYLQGQKATPYAAPFQAENLKGLPPALIIIAFFDPLRDEGLAYAHRLQQAGVPVELLGYPTIHAFMSFADRLQIGKEATDQVAEFLKKACNMNFTH